MGREIEIIIDEEGNIVGEALNFKGKGCDIAMKKAMDGLGKVTSHNKKPEFYEKDKAPGLKVGQ